MPTHVHIALWSLKTNVWTPHTNTDAHRSTPSIPPELSSRYLSKHGERHKPSNQVFLKTTLSQLLNPRTLCYQIAPVHPSQSIKPDVLLRGGWGVQAAWHLKCKHLKLYITTNLMDDKKRNIQYIHTAWETYEDPRVSLLVMLVKTLCESPNTLLLPSSPQSASSDKPARQLSSICCSFFRSFPWTLWSTCSAEHDLKMREGRHCCCVFLKREHAQLWVISVISGYRR